MIKMDQLHDICDYNINITRNSGHNLHTDVKLVLHAVKLMKKIIGS